MTILLSRYNQSATICPLFC